MKQSLSLILALLLLGGCAAKQPASVEPEQAPSTAAVSAETEKPAVIDSSQTLSAVVRLEKEDLEQYASGTDLLIVPDTASGTANGGTDYASPTDLSGSAATDSGAEDYASPTDLPGSADADSGTEDFASPTDLPGDSEPASDETPIDYGKVSTDSSKYESFDLQAKYTRLQEGEMTEFVPMEGLGTVVPYVASDLFSGKESSYGNGDARSYGLMDAGGRLLTDGIYSDVSPLRYSPEYGNPTGSVGLPFWQVAQLGELQSYGENDALYGSDVYGVVSMDGSFALPPVYYSVEAYADGFLVRGGEHRFEVYDREGTLLFNGYAVKELEPAWYSEGFYGEDLFILSDLDGSKYYYVDRSGKTVLGPYDSAGAFSDGLACVRQEEKGKGYGYIDRTGAWVIPPQFEDSAQFRDGQAIQSRDGRCVVIDRTGAEVIRLDKKGNGLMLCPFGYKELTFTEEVLEHYFYDRQGNARVHVKDGEVWRVLDDRVIGLVKDDAVELRSLSEPGQGLRLEGASFDVSYGAAMIDGKSVRGYLLKNYDIYEPSSFCYFFVTEDLTEVRELQYGCYSDSSYGNANMTFDPVTGEPYSECSQGGRRYFYSRDGSLIGSCRTDADAEVIGGMLRVTTDRACTYTDASGETVFCFPLLSLLDS